MLARLNPRPARLTIHARVTTWILRQLIAIEIPQLITLVITVPVSIPLAMTLLNMLPSSIQTVAMRLPSISLDYRRTLHPDQDEDHSQLIPRPLTHHALENLKITGYFDGVEDQMLLPFLETCSNNLTRLECPQASPFFKKAVNRVQVNLGLFLEHPHLLEWVQVKGSSRPRHHPKKWKRRTPRLPRLLNSIVV